MSVDRDRNDCDSVEESEALAAGPLMAFNLEQWIREHEHLLAPPVGNVQVWQDSNLMVTVVAGPNQRTDFHDDPIEEFFYQLRGDMTLRIQERPGVPPIDVPIRQGDVFLARPHMRHSPQRPEPGSLGLVVEFARPTGAVDAFEWYCPQCHQLVHRTEIQVTNIVEDLPPVLAAFYSSPEARTCGSCGALHPGRDP